LRCLTSALLALALAGCAASPSGGGAGGHGLAQQSANQPQPSQHPACLALVDAWAENFQANVRRLDGQQQALDQRLAEARKGLAAVGIAEESCNKPMCIIEPKANGRLESYCGYRFDDESGAALYRWVRWKPSTR
jgi:hypothetical protein